MTGKVSIKDEKHEDSPYQQMLITDFESNYEEYK